MYMLILRCAIYWYHCSMLSRAADHKLNSYWRRNSAQAYLLLNKHLSWPMLGQYKPLRSFPSIKRLCSYKKYVLVVYRCLCSHYKLDNSLSHYRLPGVYCLMVDLNVKIRCSDRRQSYYLLNWGFAILTIYQP